MEFHFNKRECRDGMEDSCLKNLVVAVWCESIVKEEIQELKKKIEECKNEISRRELKLQEIADARIQILTIHEDLYNETQLP